MGRMRYDSSKVPRPAKVLNPTPGRKRNVGGRLRLPEPIAAALAAVVRVWSAVAETPFVLRPHELTRGCDPVWAGVSLAVPRPPDRNADPSVNTP